MPVSFLFLSLGGGEIFFILLVLLLLFGSKSIPDIAKGLGKGVREFKKATSDIQKEFQVPKEVNETVKKVKHQIRETSNQIKETSNQIKDSFNENEVYQELKDFSDKISTEKNEEKTNPKNKED